MAMYWREITVNWGESDPFGLVYYPRIVAWFNDTEHELWRIIGYPIEQMIRNDRTTFVMGEIHFRFIGPAAYGDRIVTTITLADIGEHTLHWNCKAKNAMTGAPVSEGRATRVYLSGDNVLLFTGYDGYDPEVHTDLGLASRGIDYLTYPRARPFTLGAHVQF